MVAGLQSSLRLMIPVDAFGLMKETDGRYTRILTYCSNRVRVSGFLISFLVTEFLVLSVSSFYSYI